MSPEQVEGLPADHRSDIFAFGTVFYEMLSGQRPFRKRTTVETQNAILNEDPPALAGMGGAIPPGLGRVVDRCLEKKPGERFQSIRDVAFALDAVSGVSGLGGAGAIALRRGGRAVTITAASRLRADDLSVLQRRQHGLRQRGVRPPAETRRAGRTVSHKPLGGDLATTTRGVRRTRSTMPCPFRLGALAVLVAAADC
jgi:Protein tyrosine and serine/threonine kinase